MLEIKSPDQPWDKSAKTRLANIPPIYENYDGHNLEFLRKVLDARTETKRGIIYYTDGEMPAANGPEELVILQTELTNCRRKGYITLGVGINTDSPRQYGLDTVQVDSDDDIQLVIDQLGRKITER
jgi:cobalamin biosynthesis protein CobT